MTPVNRRRFLEAATGGVGALAAGPGRPSPAAGCRPTRPARTSSSSAPARSADGRRSICARWDTPSRWSTSTGPGNSRATSGGESRQIRAVYGEREIYTKWVLQAFDRWQAREAEWGKKLFYRTGQLSLATEWTKELTETRKVFDRLA